jgi:hypothetical protein
MQLANREPLALPDPRRPAQMPSLPAWVELRIGSLRENWQNGRTVLTLPASLILPGNERDHLLAHTRELGKLESYTPQGSADAEAEILVIVTKMLMVLPGQKSSEIGNEARGEAYLAALDDIAPWAVQEAVRKWYCGDHGAKFDYRWAPAPADLRALAYAEQFCVKRRISMLERVANAEGLVEFREEHRASMRVRFSKLISELTGNPLTEGATNGHVEVSP